MAEYPTTYVSPYCKNTLGIRPVSNLCIGTGYHYVPSEILRLFHSRFAGESAQRTVLNQYNYTIVFKPGREHMISVL